MIKNERTPRLLRDGYLKGIGYTSGNDAHPAWFVLGLIIGMAIGVAI